MDVVVTASRGQLRFITFLAPLLSGPVYFMTLTSGCAAHHYISSRRPCLAQQLLRPPTLCCFA